MMLDCNGGHPTTARRQSAAATGLHERLRLEIAGECFVIEGAPPDWMEAFPTRLLNCRIDTGDPNGRQIRVQLSDSEDLRPPPFPHDLNQTSKLDFAAEKVRYTADWCESRFSLDDESPVQLNVHREAQPWFGGIVENLLRVLVAYELLSRGGVMLHSAAIVRDGRASILFGHSGAGKSTASALALAAGCSVISDDINIVEPADCGWQVAPAPFAGTLGDNEQPAGPVPLRGLYHLRKAGADRAEACSPAQAIALLAGSMPFVNQDSCRADRMVDTLAALCGEIPVHELYFTRSPGFLELVF